MNRQERVLTWLLENQEKLDLPSQFGDLFERYKKDSDFDGSKPRLSNILSTLRNKGLVETPEYGHYTITERGIQKAEYLNNPEEVVQKPDGYKEVVDCLANYLAFEMDDEVSEAQFNGEAYTLRFDDLFDHDYELEEWFEENTSEFLEALDEACEEASMTEDSLNVEILVNVDYYQKKISEARNSENVGAPVTVEGMIETATMVSQELETGIFECSQCGDLYEKEQDDSKLKSPYDCDCGSKKFKCVDKEFKDIIEFSISTQKEENQKIKGFIKREKLDEKVQEVFKPGRRVRVTGIMDQIPLNKNSSRYEPILDVFSFNLLDKKLGLEDYNKEDIEKVKETVEKLDNPFEEFAKGIAPHIRDAEIPKKVVSSSLIGGTDSKAGSDDGRIHTAIYGNPGTGKSDIQEYIQETFSNTYFADNNSTGVGLTATVEQDDNGTHKIQAGKLVYADKGVLGIDELDKIDEKHLGRLNTAMEKGHFPIDKASVNVLLPGRATMIATGNYKETLDFSNDDFLDIKTYIPETVQGFMDRFSLVYGIQKQDKEKVRDSILSRYQEDQERSVENGMSVQEQVIFLELARQKDPSLTKESVKFLKKWLEGQISISEQKNSKAEFESQSSRELRSLAQLTLMFAKSRLADKTTKKDSERAVTLFYKCKRSLGFTDGDPSILE
jgi:DNA replicative helicase MCM subunit Mcm2 (Cdc46/Mcm family)